MKRIKKGDLKNKKVTREPKNGKERVKYFRLHWREIYRILSEEEDVFPFYPTSSAYLPAGFIKRIAFDNIFLITMPWNVCFTCSFNGKCKSYCLLDVENTASNHCLNGLYNEFVDALYTDKSKAAKLARKIAKFPAKRRYRET